MKKTIFLFLIVGLIASCNSKKEAEFTEESTNNAETEITTGTVLENTETEKDQFLVDETKTACETYYLTLLNSSKTFKKDTEGLDASIKQNGGTGLHVVVKKEGELIKYTVLETYADKNTVISTYFFNIKTQQLYEEDYIGATPEMLDFDKKLITKNNLDCDV
ncbi:hypothetical protein K5I29_06960 [Flavobacterium agricola]|uniref:Lipoprotein n=1 Tax=Flavobacterium agricola TaxID=2870839 RepID=A0ABY6LWI3_9FLAO|nr:hypothetical protein [Flavobacterium agricola]UYW00317.1 hypothetical protein K5I29_06960 [Flavobacterium agricola]